MKTVKIALDLGNQPEGQEKPTNKDVFRNFFIGALMSAYPQGVDMQGQRSIQKCHDGIDKGTEEAIELEDADFKFLAESFRKGKFKPQVYNIVNQIADAIDEAEKKKG